MSDDDTPGAALGSAIERLRVLLLESNDAEHAVQMRKLFVVNLIETMERARDALAAEAPQWQQLRDLFGFDGWQDGHYQGVASPDQIVTHIKHVSQERARLLFESVAAKPVPEVTP